MAKPIEVTDQNFDETLGQHPLVLVDFWAEWCAPCRMIAPILEEIAKEYEGKLLVAKLDVDENPKTAMRYRVMSIPTVILFKDGQPVEATVSVIKVNPRAEVVFYGTVSLARKGDEATAARFTVLPDGTVTNVNTLPKTLVQRL